MPSEPPPRPVLVVGATGALRPAALTLAGRGYSVYALARPGSRLTQLAAESERTTAVPVDYRAPSDLRAVLDRVVPPTVDGALLYCPAAPPASIVILAGRSGGRVVHLLTSGAADPARVGEQVELHVLPAAGVRVLLGWNEQRGWHSAEAISDAAIAAWDDGTDRILGQVRPWSDRPK